MARLTIEDYDLSRSNAEVKDLVMLYTEDKSYEGGKLESIQSELKSTRTLLSRLINVLADKNLLTDSELIEIIRGY